nr:MAG: hypothetical protein [Bacteriophage sp.]
MQVIEKVKVVPEGYNGAGMNYDGGNRRDVNGKANAGLTLGIIGTALGVWLCLVTDVLLLLVF